MGNKPFSTLATARNADIIEDIRIKELGEGAKRPHFRPVSFLGALLTEKQPL